jgi:hypothetical protein
MPPLILIHIDLLFERYDFDFDFVQVHSEGEASGGGSLGAEALAAQVARFKRVSLRKLRAWRS